MEASDRVRAKEIASDTYDLCAKVLDAYTPTEELVAALSEQLRGDLEPNVERAKIALAMLMHALERIETE